MPDDKVVRVISVNQTQTSAGTLTLDSGVEAPFVRLRLWLFPAGQSTTSEPQPSDWIRMSPQDATELSRRLTEAVQAFAATAVGKRPGSTAH